MVTVPYVFVVVALQLGVFSEFNNGLLPKKKKNLGRPDT